MANKVKYGLKNVYYSVITETGGTITYATPVKIDGAVNLTLSTAGDVTDFYADDVDYFSQYANQGYEGDLEIALLPDAFKKDILGESEDSNGALIENANATIKKFALGFEVQGDDKARRTWLYYCSASRPNVEAQTKEASITPKTDVLSMKATPRTTDENVKVVMTKSATNETAFNAFFSAVYEQVTSI